MSRLRFPDTPDDAELAAVHARLEDYNERVSGAVEKLLEGGDVGGKALTPDRELRRRIESIVETGEDPQPQEALNYLAFLDGLDELVQRAAAAR